MESWAESEIAKCVCNYETLSESQKSTLRDILNSRFPPSVYREHLSKQSSAIQNAQSNRTVLDGALQKFPHLLHAAELQASPADLSGYAVMLTAGGEGERLRLSLLSSGANEESLAEFTKATTQLPGFPRGFGSLHANCSVISGLCRKAGLAVPVIVTTGPSSSITAHVIPRTLHEFDNFGIVNVRTLAQDERLHLTVDGRIVALCEGDTARPAVNPDETGGPFRKLSKRGPQGQESALDWLRSLGCTKIIALQATGLYDPRVILAMACAGKRHDCLGVGILRVAFDAKDPFGSFVVVERDGRQSLTIVEQGIRNDATRSLTDPSGAFLLPYNTGSYVLDLDLLSSSVLPDYATPPKEILPSLPRSPKIGYAITDIMPFAKNGAVLAVEPGAYDNIKSADDLPRMAAMAKRTGILDYCTQKGR